MSYSSTVLADTPLAYYRMDASSGTSETDASGNTHTGTYSQGLSGGFTLSQAGATLTDSDTAVLFTAADTGVLTLDTLGTLGAGLTTSTVEFWIKTTSSAQECVLGTINTGTTMIYEVFINRNTVGTTTSGCVTIKIRGNTGNIGIWQIGAGVLGGGVNLNDGHYHHVAWVLSGTVGSCTISAYIDGAAVTVGTLNSNPFNFASFANFGFNMTIGAENLRGTLGAYLDGTLDEVAFYPSALSAGRIGAHFAAARGYADTPTGTVTVSGANTESAHSGIQVTHALEPYPWTGTFPNNPFTANIYKTTLQTGIGTGNTSIVVNDTPPAFKVATGTAPPQLPFYCTLDGGLSPNSEIIEVTSVGSAPYTTWTVVRGQSNTTAQTHSTGAPIQSTISLAAGFMGGDGNPSVDLGGGRVLWMSLDVFWPLFSGQTRGNFPLAHSLFGIQTGYDLTTCSFSWYPSFFPFTTVLTEFFPDTIAPDGSAMPIYFSGLSGLMIDGMLVLFAVASSNQGPENYVANVAFYVFNPSDTPDNWEWKMVPMYSEVPLGPQVGSTAVLDPGDGYIYCWGGVSSTRFLSGAEWYGTRYKRADVKAAILTNPQHWCGSYWGWTFEDRSRNIRRQSVIPEQIFVLQAWQWKRPIGDYMWSACNSGHIQYSLRADLNGAWPTLTDLFALPGGSFGAGINYAPYMHPEQTWVGKAPNDVMISYTAGLPSLPFSSLPESYIPHFVITSGI